MSQKSADKAETNGKGQEVDDEVEVVDGEDAGSDEAEEYEIEAILKDKKVKVRGCRRLAAGSWADSPKTMTDTGRVTRRADTSVRRAERRGAHPACCY